MKTVDIVIVWFVVVWYVLVIEVRYSAEPSDCLGATCYLRMSGALQCDPPLTIITF